MLSKWERPKLFYLKAECNRTECLNLRTALSLPMKYILLLFLILAAEGKAQRTNPRVFISTDIGGADPDDYQSMVHLLLYANDLDLEGLVSSPPDKGRKEHILEVIDAYEKDFPKLSKQGNYPTAEYLRAITKQGLTDSQKNPMPDSTLSEGAKWLIEKARKQDERPLYVLVWGSATDLAQALYFAPDMKRKIRVYYIGSWNTVQDTLARNYIYEQHPDLWFIENNTTFRGMYMGGFQEGDYGNVTFVEKHIKDHGALGQLFYEKKKSIKMGDTPSVLYLLHGEPDQPETDSWGGSFQKTSHGPHYFTDKSDPAYQENDKAGAKTVNRWRKAYLDDWRIRMEWIK